MKNLSAVQTLINYTVENSIITAHYSIALTNNTDSYCVRLWYRRGEYSDISIMSILQP